MNFGVGVTKSNQNHIVSTLGRHHIEFGTLNRLLYVFKFGGSEENLYLTLLDLLWAHLQAIAG